MGVDEGLVVSMFGQFGIGQLECTAAVASVGIAGLVGGRRPASTHRYAVAVLAMLLAASLPLVPPVPARGPAPVPYTPPTPPTNREAQTAAVPAL